MHLTNFKFQKILFALISILFSTSSYFATDITETIQFGGAGEDGASIIKTDIYDNIYVAGSFYSSISFGEFELTSNGVNDAFLLKMNSDNAVLWAISFGSPEDENIYDFDFDSDNNIFVTGIYSGTINFDTQTLTPTADSEAFVAKFNDSGEFVWAASSQGNIGEENKSYAVSLDYSENVIICGEYTGTITFGESTVTALDDNDIFVAKLNNDGDWLWGQTGGSNSSYDAGEDVVCDSDDNIYVTGHFREDATFGDIQVPEIGTVCIFLAKLTPEGNWEWVSPAGGSSIDMGFGVAIDSENEIFVTGMFKDDANFGEHSIVGNGEYEAFIANNIDGEWQWVVNGGSPNHEISFGIDLDNDENILISGRFRETAIFGEYQVTSNGDEDAFCAKLNSNSQEWEWVVAGGGIDQDNSLSVSSNSLNEIYFCGFFNTTATFGNTEIISNGSSDIFICKASEPVQLEANFTFSDSIGYYPLSVEFLDLSIGNPTAWSWDFQNDGIIDSNEQNPSFIYTEAGEFSVKLVTSNETEESEQIQENVIHIYENNISENLAITPDSLIFLDMDSCFNGIEITIENLLPLEMEFQNLEFINPEWEYYTDPYDLDLPIYIEQNYPYSFTLFPDAITREIIVYDTLRITVNEQFIDIPITLDTDIVDENFEDNSSLNLQTLNVYPNPFNPSTTISFDLSDTSIENTKLMIYNLKGQLVKQLSDTCLSVGRNSIVWNGTNENGNNVSSGIYFVILKNEEINGSKKLILLR